MRLSAKVLSGFLFALVMAGCATVVYAVDYRDPANLARLIEDGSVHYLLLDVRTPAEYERGHIPTAVNVPYDTVAEKLGKVDRSTLVIVYCASGYRASVAAQSLTKLGFTNVTNFGAMSSWRGSLVTGSE